LLEVLERSTKDIAQMEEHHSAAFLLLGHGGKWTYDSAKLIEYLIRILCQDQPILRFDEDVEVDDIGLEKLLAQYDKRKDAIIFSGGYRSPTGSKDDDLLNGYAVRVAHFCDSGSGMLSSIGAATDFLDDLKHIGGDPHSQVISGAGFYISSDLVELYPPFANADELVVWIDDHIKHLLHHNIDPRVQTLRVPRADFVQDRYPGGRRNRVVGRDLIWHQTTYLERLIMGCVLDKIVDDMSKTLLREYHASIRAGKRWEGILPNMATLHRFSSEHARQRADEVIKYWTDSKYRGSAIYNYASGLKEDHIRHLVTKVIIVVSEWLELVAVWDTIVKAVHGLSASSLEG
jgi:hypothetical protein